MLLGERIISAHVRNQNPLGSTSLCFSHCARLSLGSHRMDFLASGFSAATWTALVLDAALADLSASRLLHLVVQIRRLRVSNAASISRSVLARKTCSWRRIVRAASC